MRRQKKKIKQQSRSVNSFLRTANTTGHHLLFRALTHFLPPSPLLPWFPVIFTNSFFSFLFIPVCTHFSNIFFFTFPSISFLLELPLLPGPTFLPFSPSPFSLPPLVSHPLVSSLHPPLHLFIPFLTNSFSLLH